MDMVFCHGCAKEIHKSAPTCPGCGAPQVAAQAAANKSNPKGAFTWYVDVLKKYAVFNGRAGRKEFWYFTLFTILISLGLNLLGSLLGVSDGLSGLYSLAVLLPSLGVSIRRFHDTNRSGWWIFLIIINIFFLAQDGDSGENTYGPDPKAV